MPRLFIADPSLKDLRGHHYMLTRAATKSAQSAGFEVTWLCSIEFSTTLDQSGAAIAPVFGASMYDAYLKPAQTPGRRVARWSQRLKRALGNTQPAPIKTAKTGSFYDDFRAALARHDIGAKDRILLHTADGESLMAVAQYVHQTPVDALPHIHMATPYDPEGVMPNKSRMQEFPVLLADLAAAGKLGHKLFLYAENSLLAAHLTQCWGASVRPLPLPVPNTTDRTTEAKARLCEQLGIAADTFLVVSLGAARIEKGFNLMPDIVRRVFELADREALEHIKFVLHASPQIIGRDPLIAKAIDALQERSEGQVYLRLEALSDEDYQTLLYAGDIVLMPYGEREYRVRGSAVVTEALSAGKTIIAKPDTYPGVAAEQHGGRTGATPIDLARAILEVFGERDHFAARAASARSQHIDENAVDSYWRRCLDAERTSDQR